MPIIIIFALLAAAGIILYKCLCWLISLVIGFVGFVVEWSIPALLVMAIIGVIHAIKGNGLDPAKDESLRQKREKDEAQQRQEGQRHQERQRQEQERLQEEANKRRAHPAEETHARDPYAVMGVKRGSSLQDIRNVYRRLAKVLHPDVSGLAVDPACMARLNGAMEEIERELGR